MHTYLVITVFSLIALVLVRCVTFIIKKNIRINSVWGYRKKIAEIACRIQNSDAPIHTKEFVSYLADRAFDEGFFKEIVAQLNNEILHDVSKVNMKYNLKKYFTKEFGEGYSEDVLESVKCFANIVVLLEYKLDSSISLTEKGIRDVVNEHIEPFDIKRFATL
jgi:hypothetical protein